MCNQIFKRMWKALIKIQDIFRGLVIDMNMMSPCIQSVWKQNGNILRDDYRGQSKARIKNNGTTFEPPFVSC